MRAVAVEVLLLALWSCGGTGGSSSTSAAAVASIVPTTARSSSQITEEADPRPASDDGRLRISQHQTACCYAEGQVSHLIVRDPNGKEIVDRAFQTVNPTTPVVDLQLVSGQYEVESYQQPCSGNCDYLDPPTDRCETDVALVAGDTVFLTAEFAPGQGCRLIEADEPLPSPVPDEFALRQPYPDCGLDFSLSSEVRILGANRRCFIDANDTGVTAELWSYEAGVDPEVPDFLVYRSNSDRTVDVFLPNLQRATDGPWRRYRCEGLTEDPLTGFRLIGCTEPVEIGPTSEGSTTSVTGAADSGRPPP